MIGVIAFYLFAAILVLSALMVVSARNPVYSVLFLILAFFNAAGLFVLLGAEFVAMILVIVYVGAVAVLFLFVVMMLDIDFKNLRTEAMKYIPLGLILGGVLLAELVMVYKAWPQTPMSSLGAIAETLPQANNAKALGSVLYTDYIFPFQISGLILLVAMIGAIVLTLRARPGTLRQKIAAQVERNPADVLSIQAVSSGEGVHHD